MNDKPVIRLDIKGIQQIVIATVNENSPDLIKYIEEQTKEQIECLNLEEIIERQVIGAMKDKIQQFFLYGKGREMIEEEFKKLFESPQ